MCFISAPYAFLSLFLYFMFSIPNTHSISSLPHIPHPTGPLLQPQGTSDVWRDIWCSLPLKDAICSAARHIRLPPAPSNAPPIIKNNRSAITTTSSTSSSTSSSKGNSSSSSSSDRNRGASEREVLDLLSQSQDDNFYAGEDEEGAVTIGIGQGEGGPTAVGVGVIDMEAEDREVMEREEILKELKQEEEEEQETRKREEKREELEKEKEKELEKRIVYRAIVAQCLHDGDIRSLFDLPRPIYPVYPPQSAAQKAVVSDWKKVEGFW